MGAFFYSPIALLLATGQLDLSTADIRVKLLMSNTTAGSDEDAAALADITTLDEFDGGSYAEVDLAAVGVTANAAADRAELDADNGSFGSPTAGTRPVTALLFYVRIDGTLANDIPLMHDDTPSVFPLTPSGIPLPLELPEGGFGHITT